MELAPRLSMLRAAHGEHYRGTHRFSRPQMDDDYLQLVSLLSEAAGLEHSLMISYLYAMFSIKSRYAKVRGDVSLHLFMEHRTGGLSVEDGEAMHSYLDVCVEEMQHLGLVNGLLGELGAAPNLNPHQFPLPADIYPFQLDLESLSRTVVAKYLWIEADGEALDPAQHRGHTDELEFIEAVLAEFDQRPTPAMHLGSVYRRILECLTRAQDKGQLPDGLPVRTWIARLSALQYQGEIAHYSFFKDQFLGKAFGGDASIWQPDTPEYPALKLSRGTAFPGYQDTIANPKAQCVAWLSDLHYWIVLMLLDASYRGQGRTQRYKAIDGMTQCLWHLGLHLASEWGVGMPFDQLGRNYGAGRDGVLSLSMVRRYALEALGVMQKADRDGLLPPAYDRTILTLLIDSLPAPKCSTFTPVFD